MKRESDEHSNLGVLGVSPEEFDTLRNEHTKRFHRRRPFYKRKLTQTLYWTELDKELANQFWRDERWIWGVKVFDIVKLIDHGTDPDKKNNSVGFLKR